VEAVMEMLNRGGSPDAQDPDGNTALHWASWFRLESLVALLVAQNARPDVGNSSGETPVHWAAKASNVAALDAMTRADRALLSLRDCDGFTSFIISAQNDNAPIMEWMYLKGVSVEEQDDWGRTALQWACYKGHRRAVQWLLSRSASIVHRDHEGMTAIHWAALKGHSQAAEMLLEVGAVHLLDVPDAAGDTPIALAMRKKNRYLVMTFHKCQVLQFLIGRPHVSHNHFANLFVCFMAFNILVFAFVVAPGIADTRPEAVLCWSLLASGSLVLWVHNCTADPGWIRPKTIFPQHHLIGDDPAAAFDAGQPVESQMVHYEAISQDLAGSDAFGSASELMRMELEQNKLNYQRQLIAEARKSLRSTDSPTRSLSGSLGYAAAAGTGGTELQPLINSNENFAQLERAALALREKEGAAGESIGRARVERLLGQGCGEYLTLLEKGDFKQVCVVCRARRKMRSHHCKECGRCVDRLDHHCPWIDNCVGLGNQRSFFCFIASLLGVIAGFYYCVMLYATDSVLPALSHSSLAGFVETVASGSFGQELWPLVVLAASAFNLVWLAFVGALVARHSAYMAVNVTTYEVLVRPAHVQRRFPKGKGRFWFLQGFSPVDSFQHCLAYWTLDTERDAADFLGMTAQDSFVAPGEPPMASGKKGQDDDEEEGGGGRPAYHLVASNDTLAGHPPDSQQTQNSRGGTYF